MTNDDLVDIGEERPAIADAALATLTSEQGPAPSRVVASRRTVGRLRWLWPTLAISAVATGAVVLLIRPAPVRKAAPPLPGYTASIEGGVQKGGAVQRVMPRSVLTVVATPAADVHGELDARAFLVVAERVHELTVQPQISPGGSVRVDVAELSDLLDRSGAVAALRVVVGRPKALAESLDADVRWFTFQVQRVPD